MTKFYLSGSGIPSYQTRGMRSCGASLVCMKAEQREIEAPMKGLGLANSTALQNLVIKKPANKKAKNINFSL